MKVMFTKYNPALLLLCSFGVTTFAAQQKLSSNCVNGKLIIDIPLAQERMANILKLKAGNCTETNIPGGVDNSIAYHSSTESAKLTVPIGACNLQTALYENPKTTRSDNKF